MKRGGYRQELLYVADTSAEREGEGEKKEEEDVKREG